MSRSTNISQDRGWSYNGVTFWNNGTPFSITEDHDVVADSRFDISPQNVVFIRTCSSWMTMKDMAHNLYINLRSEPPAPIKYITDRTKTNGLAQVTFFEYQQLHMFPKDFPPSCPPPDCGQSSCPIQSTTTDLAIIRDSNIDIWEATIPSENALQYYPLAATEPSNWAVLIGGVEGRQDDLVAFVGSTAGGMTPGEYSLHFRWKQV
jgi:hypothetical protein